MWRSTPASSRWRRKCVSKGVQSTGLLDVRPLLGLRVEVLGGPWAEVPLPSPRDGKSHGSGRAWRQ